jgi:hypothetical protein
MAVPSLPLLTAIGAALFYGSYHQIKATKPLPAEVRMRPIIAFAITCAFVVACASAPVDATVSDSTKPTDKACKAFAARWGIDEQGSSEHERFMVACRAGEIDRSSDQKSGRWAYCVKRRIGIDANEYRSNEEWLRVMVSCL